MKKKFGFKQIMALIAVVLLVGMYVVSLILAFIHNEMARIFLKVSLTGTIVIPVVIYFIMMFYRLAHKNDNLDIPDEDNSGSEEDDTK